MSTLKAVHVHTRSVRGAAAFYQKMGLSFSYLSDHFARSDDGMLELGSYDLTRTYHAEFAEPHGEASLALQFAVPTRAAVDALYRELTQAGYRSRLAPFDAFWGARYAEVHDPDGNIVGFQSPQEDAWRKPPPLT